METSDSMLLTLGERVRAARNARGWSQRALAAAAGLSPRFLVGVESGEANVSLRKLSGLAAALEVSLVELLAGLGPVSDSTDRVAVAMREMSIEQRDHLVLELERPKKEKVALVGLRGAGKSTIGTQVALAAGCSFVELGPLVEERAGMSQAEIFEYHGAEHYRALSQEALEAALAQSGALVLEVGGSLVLDEAAYGMLREHTQVVWLSATPEEHLRRVLEQGDTRPMAGREDALGELRAILTRRESLYAMAQTHLDTEGLGLERSVGAVVSLLG
ncbi:MAG: shikimate kinase [Myxococcota bacterium]|nr:shikimate kinase [Myxococcota bacterium]